MHQDFSAILVHRILLLSLRTHPLLRLQVAHHVLCVVLTCKAPMAHVMCVARSSLFLTMGGGWARPDHTYTNSVTQGKCGKTPPLCHGTVVANRLEHGVVRGEHEPSQNIVTNNILHPMYQAHHTVGGNTRGAPSPPPQRTHMECVVPMSEDASSHAGGMRSSSAMVTSAGAVYQRRAQFRMALASCASRFLALVENRHDTIRAAHRGSFHRQWWRVCVNSLRPPPHT